MITLTGYKRGQTSVVLRVKIKDLSSNNESGKTGLAFNTASLIISTIADNEATVTEYDVTGATIETVAVLGTYAAPTATKCRFAEVDATNAPGLYEIHLANARFAVTSAKSLHVTLSGAADMCQTDLYIPLLDLDPYDAVRAGLTALPAVASGSAGAIPTTGTGSNQLNVSGGRADANVLYWNTAAIAAPNVAGYPLVDAGKWIGGTIPAVNVTGVPLVDAKYLLGTIFATPATAGILDANVKNINNVAATSVTTVSAYQGTTQPVNFTGTGGSALAKGDVVDIAGAAVSTSTAQLGVNLVNVAGSAVATGTAQLGVNVVNWAAQTALVDANNLPKVDVHAIVADTTAAANLAKSASAIVRGAITSLPTTTTLRDTSLTQADDAFFVGRIILFTSGTQKYQASTITAFATATHQLTFGALTVAPLVADEYVII